jgi:gamma-glutamylcyclotransferase (GGCT)/AIG2-like uncharacterized protein YtfP
LLYNLGRFPGITQSSAPSNRVVGDIYQLAATEETIRELDRYENSESPLPSYFERGITEAVQADGSKVQVLVYWYRGAVTETQRIESGNYEEMLR